MTKVVHDTKDLIKVSKSILFARYTLPVESERIFFCSLDELETLATGEFVGRVYKREFCELTKMKPELFRINGRRAANRMLDTKIKLPTEKGGFDDCVLAYRTVYDPKLEIMTLYFPPHLKAQIINYKQALDIDKRMYLALSVKYAQKLYKIFKYKLSFGSPISLEMSHDELCAELDISPTKVRSNNFKGRNLPEAIKDINSDKTDIEVTFEPIRGGKTGRKITGYTFTIRNKAVIDTNNLPYHQRFDYDQVSETMLKIIDPDKIKLYKNQLYEFHNIAMQTIKESGKYPPELSEYVFIALAYNLTLENAESNPREYFRNVLKKDVSNLIGKLHVVRMDENFFLYPEQMNSDVFRGTDTSAFKLDYVHAIEQLIEAGIRPKLFG